jgi:hypothetical protein
MNWKLTTSLLVGMLVITIGFAYFAHSNAMRSAAIADEKVRELQADLTRANASVNDTKGFLNFFRIIDQSDLTADDYRGQIDILKKKYTDRHPDWAKTQVQLENGSPNR